MSRRVLLTGVSGFVGGALGAWLRAKSWRVTGVSRGMPRPRAVDDFLAHDLTRPVPATWPAADVVVHCAALSSPWAAPAAYQANNVDATRHMLDYAVRIGARQFVFVSSSSVCYTSGDQLSMTEDMPLPDPPVNLYAATKRQAEDLVRNSPMPWTIVRPRAVFGPGDTVLFPRLLHAAKKGALPRIQRADGRAAVGDLIYIENLCHYIERSIDKGAAGLFHLTNNEPVELQSFLDGILEQLSLPIPTRVVRVETALAFARAAELISQYLLGYREPPVTRFGVGVLAYSKTFDVRKMIATFGAPPVTVAEGVERFVAWQRSQWQH